MDDRIIEILACPHCQSELEEKKDFLICKKCQSQFPVVQDIPVFFSQEEAKNFFTKEALGRFIKNDVKKIDEILSADSYIEVLAKIGLYLREEISLDKFSNELKELSAPGRLGNEEAEVKNKETLNMVADKAMIDKADIILDWPTGPGGFLRSMLGKIRKGSLVFALDVSFPALISLKGVLERKGVRNVVFVNADARKMPFRNNSFDSITAWGGFIEVPDSCSAVKESYRVLKSGGHFAGDGEVYKENSPSMKVAEEMNLSELASRERIEECLQKAGFKNIYLEMAFEGYEADNLPDEERCPLPAKNDWYGIAVAGGEK